MELTADIFRETAVKWRTKINVSRNWNRFEKSGDGYDYGNNIIGKPLYNILAYKMEGFYNNMEEIPYYLRPSGMLYPLSTIEGAFFTGTRRLADLRQRDYHHQRYVLCRKSSSGCSWWNYQ